MQRHWGRFREKLVVVGMHWSTGAWVGVGHVGLGTVMLPAQAELTMVLLAMGSH